MSSSASLHPTSAAFSASVARKVLSSGNKKIGWVSQLVYWQSFSLDPWEVRASCSFDCNCLFSKITLSRPQPSQLRCAVHYGHTRHLEIFNHISLSVAQEFHAFETFPALFASRGLQLQSNVAHGVLWAACELGLLALTVRRWRSGSDIATLVFGAVALPILFLKRRGPHNWYLALTTETSSVAAIALASTWLICMSPPCSSVSTRLVREIVTTAALAAPLGGWEVILAPAVGWLVQGAFIARAGRESEWSIRHIACIASAVPVALAALGVQDALMARLTRVSLHDDSFARLPYRLQHTLQLLFNGALCSAADVSVRQNALQADTLNFASDIFLSGCWYILRPPESFDPPLLRTCVVALVARV